MAGIYFPFDIYFAYFQIRLLYSILVKYSVYLVSSITIDIIEGIKDSSFIYGINLGNIFYFTTITSNFYIEINNYLQELFRKII